MTLRLLLRALLRICYLTKHAYILNPNQPESLNLDLWACLDWKFLDTLTSAPFSLPLESLLDMISQVPAIWMKGSDLSHVC